MERAAEMENGNKNQLPEITTTVDDVLILEYDETKVTPGDEAALIADLKEKLNCNVVLVKSHVKIVGKIRCYPNAKTHQDLPFKNKNANLQHVENSIPVC